MEAQRYYDTQHYNTYSWKQGGHPWVKVAILAACLKETASALEW